MGTHFKKFYHSGYLCTVRTVNINENNRTKILLISISFKAFKLYFIVSPFIKKWETIIFGVFGILWVKRNRIELLFCHFNSSWQLIVMKEFWRSSTAEHSTSNLRFTHLSSRNLLRVILCDCPSSATGTPPWEEVYRSSCLAFPVAFTQPEDHLLADPCNELLLGIGIRCR